MPRGKRAKQLEQAAQSANPTDESGLPPQLRDDTPAQEPPPTGRQPGDEPEEPGKKQWVDRGPQGRQGIDLGDGRRLRFFRWDKMQQSQIRFIPEIEGVDPRPAKEDTEFMKQHGFRWRGGEEMAWTRQLFTDADKQQIEAVDLQKGQAEAQKLRSQIRGDSDRIAQEVFVELANRIRQRNGLEPIDYSFGQERSL